ncbi:DUF881 domain-containing protein [Kytococcus sedentarius]|uniref:DUF881 domain-containing protein n=1 Tax=Kytococcus sedentarius TaxID=1276 RepID=UPI0035BBF902
MPDPQQEAPRSGRPRTPAPRPDRRRGWRALTGPGSLTVAVLLGALGFALSTSSLDRSRDTVRELTEAELVELLHDVEQHDDELDDQRRVLLQQKAALAAGQDSSEAERQARARAQELGILAGVVPASGEGIHMTIPVAGELGAPALLDAVQELRDAGAEVLEVNDRRVVASTWFVDDTEGRVVMDGEPLEPPYRIEAIGPAQTMATAMEIPGGVVESAQQEGSTVRVLVLDDVRIESTVPLDG